jgi:hypothetical protein
MPLSVAHEDGRRAFLDQLARFVDACGALSDVELLAASRCRGWAVLDAVVHVRAGVEEMLFGIVAPTDASADTDAASYWAAAVPTNDTGADDVAGILWTRRTASAYRRPSGAVAHLRSVADAVAGAVAGLPAGRLRFQGHVLSTGDFLATWAVELAVHHVDLGREVDVGSPTDESLALTRATIEALLGAPLPGRLDDRTALLLGTGRTVPTADQARLLGELADRLPVLG